MAPIYRAMAGPGGDELIHLVRDGSEAALCGLPTLVLRPVRKADELVCPECIEWLPKRIAASAEYRRAEPRK